MHCEQALTLISADLDHEARPADRAWLDEHLKDCGGCSATAEAFRLQDAENFEPRTHKMVTSHLSFATVVFIRKGTGSVRSTATPKKRHRGLSLGRKIPSGALFAAAAARFE